MDQVECPQCTYLNNSTNTSCDICDTGLHEYTKESSPLEDQFMQITGESRSIAQEYMKVSNNNIYTAVGYYYQDKELETTNSQFLINTYLSVVNSSSQLTTHEPPKNVEDLTCQLLYTTGRNSPHHCVICDSSAFLVAATIISYNCSVSEIIRLMRREDLEELQLTEDKYEDTIKEVNQLVNNKFLPLIVSKLLDHIKCAYFNRDKLLETTEIETIENTMTSLNGLNFRLIWDTLHPSNEKLEDSVITDTLYKLATSEEFHSYLNQSWDPPEHNHPASKEVISGLKKVKLTTDCPELESLKENKCAICMSEFTQDDEKEVTMLGCHSFCTECITPWLEEHNDTCPICRKTVGSCNDETGV